MVGTKTVDKDLKRLSRVEKATLQMGRGSVKIGIGFLLFWVSGSIWHCKPAPVRANFLLSLPV